MINLAQRIYKVTWSKDWANRRVGESISIFKHVFATWSTCPICGKECVKQLILI